MKLPAIIKVEVTGLKEVIELQAKYDELMRGVGDLILILNWPERDYRSLLNKNESLRWVMKRVIELIKENRELKEKVK